MKKILKIWPAIVLYAVIIFGVIVLNARFKYLNKNNADISYTSVSTKND